MLGDISNIVQVVGLPLAIIAIFFAYREGRNSRDLQAALTFSDSFRTSWEASWRKALRELQEHTAKGDELPQEMREEVYNMLNWLDWVGWLIHSETLARPNHVLGSIAPVLVHILDVTAPVVAADEEINGTEWWHGVRILEHSLKGTHDLQSRLPRSFHPVRPWARIQRSDMGKIGQPIRRILLKVRHNPAAPK
jgi:hypothetical protein